MSYCFYQDTLNKTHRFILSADNRGEMVNLLWLKDQLGVMDSGDRIVFERPKMDEDNYDLDRVCAYMMGLIHDGPLLIGHYMYGMRGWSLESYQRAQRLQEMPEFGLGQMRRISDGKVNIRNAIGAPAKEIALLHSSAGALMCSEKNDVS